MHTWAFVCTLPMYAYQKLFQKSKIFNLSQGQRKWSHAKADMAQVLFKDDTPPPFPHVKGGVFIFLFLSIFT